MILRAATAQIDLSALTTNFKLIKQLAPTSQVLAVLKANAYGHGLAQIAKALPHADAFGVARIDEALALRANGITQAIVLLEGFFAEDEVAIIAANNLQTVVHNQEQLDIICQARLDRPLKVWLKIDTGMHRLGIDPDDFTVFYQKLKKSNNVQSPLVLMSHLASADDQKNSSNEHQINLFRKLSAELPDQKSLANSAGICAWQDTHLNWLRPGLLLYGVSPMNSVHQLSLPIQPVMTLKAQVISVRHIKKGQAVGYGGHWQSQQDTMIGVIAIGYGDGYPRHAENGTPVLINGSRVPLVGRVSMDMITVDLGPDATVKIGDQATLWGKDLPIEEVAKYATTIPYELLCNVSQRVHMTTIT
jgi:alanine racemase